jgi:hypothetical protein
VSDGPIKATGSGGLRVNCSDVNPSDNVTGTNCMTDPPSAATFYLRSGDLLDAGKLDMRETFVYTKTGTARLAGQSTIDWSAPLDGPFEDLALWTESATLVKITGGAQINIDGILFAPNANLELAGNTGSEALDAQLWVKKLDLVGGAQFRLVPKADRLTKVGKGKQLLIR